MSGSGPIRTGVLAAVALAVAAVLLPACGGGRADRSRLRPAGPELTVALAGRLDARFRHAVRTAGIPGASASVVFPDGRAWSGAAGLRTLEPSRRMTSSTALVFDSVTKVATAALALRLAERGRLALDDPVARWYPDWSGDERATVRDLLRHTAGVRDPPRRSWERLVRRPGARFPPRRVVAATGPPGPRTDDARYSNTGYLIAGLVLERAAGQPLARAVRRELFGHPGGSGLALQPGERPHPPLGHAYAYPRGLGDPVDLKDNSPYLPFRSLATAASAAGGLAGDVPSLARWGHALFTGRVLAPRSLREMTDFERNGLWEGYGLGLARSSLDGRELWGHVGDGWGTHTEFWHVPRQRVTLAVTWNDDLLDSESGIQSTLLRTALAAP